MDEDCGVICGVGGAEFKYIGGYEVNCGVRDAVLIYVRRLKKMRKFECNGNRVSSRVFVKLILGMKGMFIFNGPKKNRKVVDFEN